MKSRAVDDPVKLARSARMMRSAPRRQQRTDDEYIKAIVDAAPPLTDDQKSRLAVLFEPVVQQIAAERRAQAVPQATRRRQRKRKRPADIAAEMISDLIEQQKQKSADREELEQIRKIMEHTGQDFAEAHGNWRAIQAFRQRERDGKGQLARIDRLELDDVLSTMDRCDMSFADALNSERSHIEARRLARRAARR